MASSLEKLKESHDVDIVWHSFELRPAGSLLDPAYKEKILAARPRFAQMAREQYGLKIDSGPFGFNSRPALIGAKYAEAQGAGEAYHDVVLRAYWEEAKDIENLETLAELADQIGLEKGDFLAALAEEHWDEAVSADITLAHQSGINSVPSIVFADKYIVSGAYPYPQLLDLVGQVENALKTL